LTRGAPLDVRYAIELPEPYGVVDQVAFAIKHKTEQYLERLRALTACAPGCASPSFLITSRNTESGFTLAFFTAPELIDRVRWQLEHTRETVCFLGSPAGSDSGPGMRPSPQKIELPMNQGCGGLAQTAKCTTFSLGFKAWWELVVS
jgi:hypothetical protein